MSLEQITGLVISRLGLSVSQMDDLTPVELHYGLVDFFERNEQLIKADFERMRLQTMYLVNIQVRKEDQKQDVTKFMPLPWDEKKKQSIEKQSVDDMKNTLLSIAKRVNKNEKSKLKSTK
jgi:hypothetical protein